MGHDVIALGNHTLRTVSIESLAIDLSERLQTNVEMTCLGDRHHLEMLGIEPVDSFQTTSGTIGKLVKDPALKTIYIADDDYPIKKLLEIHGDRILETPDFWYDHQVPSDKQLVELKENLREPTYLIHLDSTYETSIWVFKESYYSNVALCPYRWWGFCDFFLEERMTSPEWLKMIMEYRTELRTFSTRIGGNRFFYVDDQGKNVTLGHFEETVMSWKQIEDLVYSLPSDLTINVADYFSSAQYRNQIIHRETSPTVFIDNYTDLDAAPG